MEIFISDSYELFSKRAANDVKEIIQSFNEPLLCTASGDSPAGLYKALVDIINRNQIDISTCNFVGLDEWAGMNGSDEGSCRYYLNKQLFNPLNVPENRICFFDGRANDLQKECDNVESFVSKHNGIDLAIIGLGMNGHIGMNEPGTSISLRSHIARIDPATQKAGQKYFKEPRQLSSGLTLGLATLLESKNIFLLVSGRHKAEIVKRVLEEDVSKKLPASLLRNHRGLKIYLDTDAALLVHSN